MKLLRLALLHFDPFPEDWLSFTMNIKGVYLGTMLPWCNKEERRVCVVAEVDLHDRLELTHKNQITIPSSARKRAEQAIEAAASMIAVAENCAHSISSPIPCAALKPENDQEQEFLEGTDGIAVDPQKRGIPSGVYRVSGDLMVQAVGDRLDGVALLAEALSQKHATGRFHEFIRLFERAFRLSSIKLIEALSQYLAGAELGYTKEEVRKWVKDLRDPATHADGKYQAHFVLQSDVRPVIRRMEQAAYDVLLNKADWHNPSPKRKAIWSPSAGTCSAGGDVFIVQGKGIELHFKILDEFSAYPSNLGANITKMPNGWWSEWSEN
jgi:hypothetical protein